MVVLAFIALTLQGQAPEIKAMRTLTGGQARLGCWLPIEVTLASSVDFEGHVVVRGGDVHVARAIQMRPGELKRCVLPALPATREVRVSVELRTGEGVVARGMLEEEICFLRDDERLVLPAGAQVHELDPTLFEAVDEVPGEAWVPRGRFRMVEPASMLLRPSGGWIQTQRAAAIFYVILYLFAALVLVVFFGRRGPVGRFALLAMALAVFSSFGLYLMVPRGHVAVEAWSAVARGVEYRLNVIRGDTAITFSELAKPIFPSFAAVRPVEIEWNGGCTVKGWPVVLTQRKIAPPSGTTAVDEGSAEVQFFRSRLGGAQVRKVDVPDVLLGGISGPGLVEARLVSQVLFMED